MKNILITLALLLSFGLYAQKKSLEVASLDQIVGMIDEAVLNAEVDGKVQLTDAEVSLKTVKSGTASGGFSFLIKASSSKEIENSVQFTYRFSIPEGDEKSLSLNMSKVENSLSEAIASASAEWTSIKSSVKGLEKKDFTVALSFIVTKNASGGIEFEVFGAGINLDGKYKNSAIHTITLTFKDR